VAHIFGALAETNVSVDMIIQNISLEGFTDLTFTVSEEDAQRAKEIAEEVARELGAPEVSIDTDVVKVSIVGVGMRNHAGIAARMFRLLANEGINIRAISTSEIKTSCLIDAKYSELAVRALHDGFKLGDKPLPR
jgi:aspartate kinase